MSVRRTPGNVPQRPGFDPRGIALVFAFSALAGCTGGTAGTGSVGFACASGDPRVLCIENCNLGCTSTGCGQTDIAQNQIVIINFSEDVDPSTVGPTSIRFRTAAGEQPVGEFLVTNNRVEFVPTLAISGGQTFFGFSASETYTMTIPGGEGQTGVLRSTSGKPFERTLTCTLRATLGIVDLNGVSPRATLVVPPPERWTNAPLDTDIVIEFNEMIDATPFLSGTQSPVTFEVRRNLQNPSGAWECNPNSAKQPLIGTQVLDYDAGRGVSVLTFRPVQNLPANVCIEINVTDGVADLSGRPAQPQTFNFLTEVVPLTDHPAIEEFDTDDMLDIDASAGTWGGGVAQFAQIGGDGRHGDFSLTYANNTGQFVDGKALYTLNTENQIIPASNTITGVAMAVTDGRFYFSTMVVPANVRLRFVGAKAPTVTVAGRFDVLGQIDVAGFAPTGSVPLPSQALGQPGGVAGAGGGAGGAGGDKITLSQAVGVGALPQNQGRNGVDVTFLPGHGYSPSSFNTGGRGAAVFPTSGLNSAVYYGGTSTTQTFYSPSATAGGGGGGFVAAGVTGVVTANNHPDPGLSNVSGATVNPTFDVITVASANWTVNRYAPFGAPPVPRQLTFISGPQSGQARAIVGNTINTITVTPGFAGDPTGGNFNVSTGPSPNRDVMGPPANGGVALQLFPFPPPAGFQRSSQHFLVGGAGGGGAGSSACLSLNLTTDRWAPGCGGGGGAGAVALRAGHSLLIAPAAKVLATGGSALNNNTGTSSTAQPSPGGGGSGGSVLLQAGNLVEISGLIDVRGGLGGLFSRFAGVSSGAPPTGASVQIAGGNGANGFVRLEETTQPPLSHLSTVQPPLVAPATNNLAVLAERDDLVVMTSKFYSTGQLFGPEFARYEIYGTMDGAPFTLSDDPAISTAPALPGAPVRALFQAAQLDLVTGVPTQFGPWRTSVRSAQGQTGIDADGFNGYRFKLFADYTLGTVITIDRVVVVYRI